MGDFKFNNGDGVIDIVTGFKGSITGRADYKHSNNTYLVECLTINGTIEMVWIHEERLSIYNN